MTASSARCVTVEFERTTVPPCGRVRPAVSSSRAPLALLVASWIAAPGCLGGRDQCLADGDCEGGEECTRTGECVAQGTALRVVVRWTVAGQGPTPAASGPCAGIEELEVVFRGGPAEPQRYRPIPCELGQTTYDKMPPRYDWVEVNAYDSVGERLDSRGAELEPTGESDVLVDLTP